MKELWYCVHFVLLYLAFPILLQWKPNQISVHRHTEESWHVKRRCRKRGHQADRKSQCNRESAEYLERHSCSSGPSAICPRAGEARPGDKLPWQHVAAICCWSMYIYKLACMRMAWDAIVWSAPNCADLNWCVLICSIDNAELCMIFAGTQTGLPGAISVYFWLGHDKAIYLKLQIYSSTRLTSHEKYYIVLGLETITLVPSAPLIALLTVPHLLCMLLDRTDVVPDQTRKSRYVDNEETNDSINSIL